MIKYPPTVLFLLFFFIFSSNLIGIYIGYKIAGEIFFTEKKETVIVNANLIVKGLLILKVGDLSSGIKYYQNTLCGYLLGIDGTKLSQTGKDYLVNFKEEINEYIELYNLDEKDCPLLE